MSIEKGAGKKEHEFYVDEQDLIKARALLRKTLHEKGIGPGHWNNSPDDAVLPEGECTPDREAAEADFLVLDTTLRSLGIDIRYSRTLEIGSGRGEFLRVLKDNGVSAIGIDTNPRHQTSFDDPIEIVNAPLSAVKAEKVGQFPIIFAKNVFDDDRYAYQNYQEMLGDIDSLLTPGGIFIKMGFTGSFTDNDIPQGWERVRGTIPFDLELYRKT